MTVSVQPRLASLIYKALGMLGIFLFVSVFLFLAAVRIISLDVLT